LGHGRRPADRVFHLLAESLAGGRIPAAKQAKARQQARVNPPQPPAEKQRVEDEVGEFLRRAAQQRGGRDQRSTPANQPPRPPKPVRNLVTAPERQESPKTLSEQADAIGRPRTLTPTLDDAPSVRKLTDRTIQPVEVQQSEKAMQSHLQQAFGHTVGTLGDIPASVTAEAPPSASAGEVMDMFRNPQTVREAIIVSEIIRRPEERW
jgi:hypothetical protein